MENGVTTHPDIPSLLLMDACVLIDFVKSDQTIFRLLSEFVGLVNVVSPVVDEVKDIEGAYELEKMGVIILEPTLDDVFIAANTQGSISFQDRLCLLMARRNGFTCVTNDVRLRKECEKENVPFLWGLELLIKLYKRNGITADDALEIALKIQEKNPKHITPQLLERFKGGLGL